MRLYLRAIGYFKQDAGKIALSLLLLGASVVLGVLWPLPVGILFDVVFPLQEGKGGDQWWYRLFNAYAPEDKPGQILLLTLTMLLLRLTEPVLRTIQTILNIRVGYNGLMRVRCELFQKFQVLSLAYHKSQPQGDAIYRLTSDASGFQSVLNVVTGLLVNVITLVTMAWIMFSMNWRLTLVSLAVVPLLMITIRYYGKVLTQRYTQAWETDSRLTTAIQRSLISIGLVQAFGREVDEYQNFESTVGHNVRVRMRLHWDEVLYWLILGIILGVGSAAIFGYGAWLVYRGSLQPGMLVMFLFYLDKLYDPLNKLSASGSSLQGAGTQVKRVFEVVDRDPVIRDAPGAIHLPRQPRTLALENLSFEYRPGEPVLRELSMTIPPGQMVAFVGSSGVGKTTLLNLLPRFYDPTTGAITLDGHDLRTIKVKDLRQHVALVLQESIILPTSVRENIAYGLPGATDAQVKKAAALAGADAFIEKLPQQYDTEVSESGSNLSGGQKQRISIARALLTEAPIIVMDEPTSALDPQNEQLVTETLKALKGQRTMILVSHRLSTVADCDQIFVIDAGRLIEQGTHDQLVARRGHYYQMARHQMKLEDAPVGSANP